MARAHQSSMRMLAGVALLAMLAIGSAPRRARGAPMRGRGPILTLEQLRELARTAGFVGVAVDVAAAVAMAESSGCVWAQGDPRGDFGAVPNGVSKSFGLWQVHAPAHPEFEPARLLDATYNARAAFVISRGGSDWRPWTTYRDGAFRAHMPGGEV